MGYGGNAVYNEDFDLRKKQAMDSVNTLVAAADDIEADGMEVKIISAGGTGTYDITGKVDRVTELQCGSYLFMDSKYLEVFGDHPHPVRSALTIQGTVTSKPAPGRTIADPGLKAISTDKGRPG